MVGGSLPDLAAPLVARTGQHGQPGVPREAGIQPLTVAPDEDAAAIVLDDAAMTARIAEPGGRVGLPWSLRIVHHDGMFTSEATTRGVRVAVVSEFAPARSRPQDQQWFFLYTITITNESDETVQLISRHWVIKNGAGDTEEVRGAGVVGEQPILKPNDSFTYTSGCPLRTSFGTMEGTYQMVTGSGESFDVRIAQFTLSEPYTVH
jgi:ApaG protein